MVSTEVERYDNDVDPADVPSAKWGWSRVNHRTWHITGFVIAIFLLATMHGAHPGNVENIFVIGFAVAVLVITIRDMVGRRRGWLR
ncbi:DUF2631 domain-containing protein [[Mycobacterium] burgundiense]|jgi:hypothetical protein|uniref:DUF2631 domain-containing protein n=1 Tax=[Mycobacterium] burgundiense TaxID=3064286 RepID=A0ABM9LXJ4_9MYCO|nr:DUF2631 domain-containing protein [Mycolicibacterium sp. MU0053]CAJ1506411.1 DUF2631 domain-containing protein [Mycolicibacterium sp. MU0053]